eukprot:4463910-Pyramimonas_sp.AAC.1
MLARAGALQRSACTFTGQRDRVALSRPARMRGSKVQRVGHRSGKQTIRSALVPVVRLEQD